jgi:hypothetical protein
VVLGGLFKEDTGVSRNQVPGLGEIPGLGLAFQGQEDTVQRSEVIFLIKPTIMKDKTLAKMGDQMQRDIEDARLGARKGLLPWSRTKLTSSHMKQALEHKRAGETEEALWDTNLALYLDPTMVDAIQLKEELTGEQMKFHERSRLNDVINGMVEEQLESDNAQQDNGNAGEAEQSQDADQNEDGKMASPSDNNDSAMSQQQDTSDAATNPGDDSTEAEQAAKAEAATPMPQNLQNADNPGSNSSAETMRISNEPPSNSIETQDGSAPTDAGGDKSASPTDTAVPSNGGSSESTSPSTNEDADASATSDASESKESSESSDASNSEDTSDSTSAEETEVDEKESDTPWSESESDSSK